MARKECKGDIYIVKKKIARRTKKNKKKKKKKKKKEQKIQGRKSARRAEKNVR